MTLDYQTLIRELTQVIWPLGRLGGLMLSLPVLSSSLLPARIKIALVLALSWICAPFIPAHLSLTDFNGLYPVFMVEELCLGLLMGFTLQLVFQIFVLGGQILSMQAGLGFALMVDPSSKASVPLISQFYMMMTSLIFLALNGHLAVIKLLVGSYKTMPVGTIFIDGSVVWQVLLLSGWMLKQAVLISIPAILSLLMVTLSFGIMARVAPQLNIFSLGFSISLLMAMAIIQIGLGAVSEHITDSIEYGLQFIKGMMH